MSAAAWTLRRLAARTPIFAAAAVAGAFGSATHAEKLPQFRARVTDKKEVANTRFIKLETLTYKDQTGRSRKWDMATRTTRRPGTDVDAVAILALLRTRADPSAVECLLVQQFRPPVNAVTVELPAGLIDPGESAEAAALRELKEETGYTGELAYCSAKLSMSPGLCDECVQLVVVEVDLDAPTNRMPAQALEDDEFIKVARVPVRDLLPTLQTMQRDGYLPFTGLFTLALGLQLGGTGLEKGKLLLPAATQG